ncbi:hypothetical protein G9A89_014295 [Geosiphon pyriformis]|nr:hypothetical protein G9A89_014295 [Geosiphon pyriformis]
MSETLVPAALKLTDFVRRPGCGHEGREIRVRANFFEVLKFPISNLIHYDVMVTPDVPPSLNRKVFQSFEETHPSEAMPVYDGRRNVFSNKILPFGDAATFQVNLPQENSSRAHQTFTLIFKKVAQINMEELKQFLKGESPLTPNCLTGIMALDVLIRHHLSMLFTTVGRSFYTSQNSQVLSGGVEAWQGYYQSVRPARDKMMINVSLTASAFYEGGPVLQLVCKQLGKRSAIELARGIPDNDRLKLEKSLKYLKVRVTHRGTSASQLRFRIIGLTELGANKLIFTGADNLQMDVASYFETQYNYRLIYPYLPCVIIRRNNFLPMEVCEVIEGQRYIRKLNEKQTADMIKFTCQPPNIRANKINQGLSLLNYNDSDYMRGFGMKVSNEMALIPARVLPAPTLHYHPSSREAIFQPRDGTWNLRNKKVATGATLGSWSVVVFGNEHGFPMQAMKNFVRELVITCTDTGMDIRNKTPPILHANPIGDVEGTIKQAWIRAGNLAKARPQLILIILPNAGEKLYAEIKRVGDTVIGVATQCCQGKHAFAVKKQYCANVCLKINVKLGGMNSFLPPNEIQFISGRPTILIGADVAHSFSENPSRPSIAAVCGSMDAKASRYSASIRVQTARQDIIDDLAGMIKELLKTFYQTCGKKPERILMYRDGVSESQFAAVLADEVTAIRAACHSLEPSYKPTLTFVIVQKGHHARFFPIDRKEADRSGNCLPGTVVERMITHPVEFDFYLLSHAGLQGTSRPCHYHVLLDENHFIPDDLQTLSYNLCYLYARCTRAVSLVPPVYYAHLICKRARFHAYGSFSDATSSDEEIFTEASFATVKPELQRVMYFM